MKTVTAILYNSSQCELTRVTDNSQSKLLIQVEIEEWLESITDGDTIKFEVQEDD